MYFRYFIFYTDQTPKSPSIVDETVGEMKFRVNLRSSGEVKETDGQNPEQKKTIDSKVVRFLVQQK